MIHQTIPKPRSGQRTDQSKPYASPARLSDRSVQRVSDGAPPSGHNFADVAVHQTDSQPAARVRSTVPSHRTGLPDALKAGVERLAGISLDDVRVHYNSAKPAQLDALAYAQGRDIHIAPGQERHLPHEAWHVVQQAHGRVQPTMQMTQGRVLNEDQGLEREAEVMGAKARHTTDFTHPTLRDTIASPGAKPAPRHGFAGMNAHPPAGCAADGVVQRFVVPGGTKNKPQYYSSLDPQRRMFASFDEADAHDRQLEQQRQPQHQVVAHPPQQPQPQVVQQPPQQPPLQVAQQPPQPARDPAQAQQMAGPVNAARPGAAGPVNGPGRFPLGFANEQQFRDATRPLARRFRDAQIVVTGSSVTGRSGDGKRRFRPASTRVVRGVKKSGPSDIDIGVVKPGTVGRGEVDDRGFPRRGTDLATFERDFGAGIKAATGGHPSGIKFFEDVPLEPRRGRSRTRNERPRIVREHTPEGLRQDDERL